jgi:hypothetical protein
VALQQTRDKKGPAGRPVKHFKIDVMWGMDLNMQAVHGCVQLHSMKCVPAAQYETAAPLRQRQQQPASPAPAACSTATSRLRQAGPAVAAITARRLAFAPADRAALRRRQWGGA